jgi:hypothetical protein
MDAGTECSGEQSTCGAGSDCGGAMSMCMDAGTDCSGQNSECSAGATCHGAGSTCNDYTSMCTAANSTCNTGAACPGNFTIHFTNPRPQTIRGMDPNETITSGFTDQVADFLEIEVPAPYTIDGYVAKSAGPCVLVATDGTEIPPDPGSNPPTHTIPPGKVVRKLRCPGKSTREVEFHLFLNARPPENTSITARAFKGGGAPDTANMSVLGP